MSTAPVTPLVIAHEELRRTVVLFNEWEAKTQGGCVQDGVYYGYVARCELVAYAARSVVRALDAANQRSTPTTEALRDMLITMARTAWQASTDHRRAQEWGDRVSADFVEHARKDDETATTALEHAARAWIAALDAARVGTP